MKAILKVLFKTSSIVLVSPIILSHWLARLVHSDGLFVFSSQLLSLAPGALGSYLRVAFYRFAMTRCSSDILIGFGSLFSQPDTEIGSGVYIGPQCNIGMCAIGDNTLLASGVHVMSGNRQHHTEDLDTPIQQQGGEFSKVTIGEDCWIGNGSLVMADIGDKCIVGAGSVVTKPIPAYSIAVGNPARVIQDRKAANAAAPPPAS